MQFKGFIGPSYNLPKSANVECQRAVNLFIEIDEAGTQKDGGVAFFRSTEGLKKFLSPAYGPLRGFHVSSLGDVVYFVTGSSLYVMDARLQPLKCGDLLTNVGPVSMADNGVSIYVVDNPNGYFGDLSRARISDLGHLHNVAQTTDPNWQGASQVSIVDGYFIFNKVGSFQWYVSNLLDTTINPLGFASKEATDPIVGHIGDHRNIWFFGSLTTEVWYNAGISPGVPFQIIQGSFMQIGCCSGFSIRRLANTIFWLGKDENGQGIVYKAVGYQAQRVSTHAIEAALNSYGDLSGATAWAYSVDGHQFYCLNVPGAPTTFCFDVATGLWHERCAQTNGILTRHRAEVHAFAFNTHMVGDYQNGNLYFLDAETFDDNGSEIIRMRSAPHLSGGQKRVRHNKFQLDFEAGVGLSTGQGDDPQVMLQFSDDGGYTWSSEKWRSLGKIGKTKWRAIWWRLGEARNRVYRIMISDPIKVVIIGADLDVEVLAS